MEVLSSRTDLDVCFSVFGSYVVLCEIEHLKCVGHDDFQEEMSNCCGESGDEGFIVL